MENKAQTFRFLDLPGEIRNRIYEFCQSNDFIILNLRDRYDENTRSDHKVMPIVKSHQGQESNRLGLVQWWKLDYFGLTQVNHLIRSEYLPLYYNSDKVYVDPKDLPAYAEAFLGVGTPHPSRPSTVVTGVIASSSWLHDLTPLLKLAAENTDVYFIYQDYVNRQNRGGNILPESRGFVRIVNMLLRKAQHPRYKEGWCVAAGMLESMYICGRARPYLQIAIKTECYNMITLENWGQTNSEFLEITGLDMSPVGFRIEYPNQQLCSW
ncbi:hypothetical protein K505DRAFT_373622 [Melanomma pulvis-pyrius CBS 109.77]|uniref:F-box domain-containing protein n=1 Tax=Melanomma pulvis-pyrius CBS 109.77 TaxID=1314802 RepID=A0A6A6XH84_9PLEO|nr:hypothetical protein K505DRAFT_373622 [Melanomma pulvis-pyrius CBS 109.77]